jgi:hypothetical protein
LSGVPNEWRSWTPCCWQRGGPLTLANDTGAGVT